MSKAINKKINFSVLFTVCEANPNGDPLDGNRPRTNMNGYGRMTPECFKRKIRNRMQDLGANIFVQSADRCTDGCKSLKERADQITDYTSKEEYEQIACKKWLDVRTFGQVFAIKGAKKGAGISSSITGPVTVEFGRSISPVTITQVQIVKSVNGETTENGKKSSDTMGTRYIVEFGLYRVNGSISVELAEKYGFTEDDAKLLKECLATLFDGDESSARPDGSIVVKQVYWWEHSCKIGNCPSERVFDSLHIELKDDVDEPESLSDYEITLDEIDRVSCEKLI